MRDFLPLFRAIALMLALVFSACAGAPASSAAQSEDKKPAPAGSAQLASASAPIEVMILSTYHMGNPGQDLINAKIDPVTTPEKQAQLEEVATLLARFQPTAVAVERLAADPATMLDQQYPAFKPADLTTSPDERVQVGYRLAAKLKLARVYAIDEQDRPGEVSYFPFEELMAWAAAHGRQSELEDSVRGASAFATELEAKQVTHTVGELLAEFNAPDAPMCAAGNGLYMQLVSYGSGSDQPGAVLNGRWFTRNAMIFAKLTQVAKPGDRIVVIYGGGHAYWLRNLVAQMPGYRLIEAVDFLPARKK